MGAQQEMAIQYTMIFWEVRKHAHETRLGRNGLFLGTSHFDTIREHHLHSFDELRVTFTFSLFLGLNETWHSSLLLCMERKGKTYFKKVALNSGPLISFLPTEGYCTTTVVVWATTICHPLATTETKGSSNQNSKSTKKIIALFSLSFTAHHCVYSTWPWISIG